MTRVRARAGACSSSGARARSRTTPARPSSGTEERAFRSRPATAASVAPSPISGTRAGSTRRCRCRAGARLEPSRPPPRSAQQPGSPPPRSPDTVKPRHRRESRDDAVRLRARPRDVLGHDNHGDRYRLAPGRCRTAGAPQGPLDSQRRQSRCGGPARRADALGAAARAREAHHVPAPHRLRVASRLVRHFSVFRPAYSVPRIHPGIRVAGAAQSGDRDARGHHASEFSARSWCDASCIRCSRSSPTSTTT